jgi:DNA-binding MarR family transcriptional regulator
MTDLEFEVLDQLYFVESFRKIQEELALDTETLKDVLKQMIEKGWVKCFSDHYNEVVMDTKQFEEKYTSYQYLATKEGLLAHNSR